MTVKHIMQHPQILILISSRLTLVSGGGLTDVEVNFRPV